MLEMQFYIDIVGSCNLSCPSCPQGNSRSVPNPKGLMSLALMEQVLDKAVGECKVHSFNLYNWTEPLIHPQLAEMVRLVHSRGVPCGLSTNLNHLGDIEAVMAEKPDGLRVSLSGFTQERYGVHHRGGDIEKVKANLLVLADCWKKSGQGTYVEVCFHRYRDNLDDEPAMKEYVEGLGLTFTPIFAGFNPLEKVLAVVRPQLADTELTADDRAELSRLVLPLPETFALIAPHLSKRCALLEGQIVLNYLAEVQLCCAVFDAGKFGLGSYLSQTIDEIQKGRYAHSMCGTCMDTGFNVLCTETVPELEERREQAALERRW